MSCNCNSPVQINCNGFSQQPCAPCQQPCAPCQQPCIPCQQPCIPCQQPCVPCQQPCSPCRKPSSPCGRFKLETGCGCGCSKRKHKSPKRKCEEKYGKRSSRHGEDKCKGKRSSRKGGEKCSERRCGHAKCVPCFETKCGIIQASLNITASSSVFTAAGQIITYTYTITNTGSVPICDPIRICDDRLGGQIIPCSFIVPGCSQAFTRTYTVIESDLTAPGITNTATAYIEVDCECWVTTCPASVTITFGSADLFGTMSQSLESSTDPDTVVVTTTIVNSSLSASAAQNVSITLPFPPGISGVISGVPAPTSIGPNSVSFALPSLAIGASATFRFQYTAGSTVPGASYTFSGNIISSTFDPNPSNNFVSNTFVFP